MIYLGIDPGASGGIAWLDNGHPVATKMPDTDSELIELLNSACCFDEGFCCLEKVHAMPKQGVSSTFAFGRNFGAICMALAATKIPYDLVAPGIWQRSLRCLSKGDKRVTKRRAQELFPGIKVTHAIADALLIAEYCRRQRKGRAQ